MIVPCAACKTPVERLDLIAGLCSTCLAAGAPIPLGESDKLTERNLMRGEVQGSPFNVQRFPKHIKTPPRAAKREETMPTLKACRYCGKEMPKGSLFRHEHGMCEKRPGAESATDSPAPKIAVHAKRPMKRATARALVVLAGKAKGFVLSPGDCVNHPAHYNKGTIKVIDFIEDQELGFHLGNVIKYVCRQTDLVDLKKAAWYLDRHIARQERQAAA